MGKYRDLYDKYNVEDGLTYDDFVKLAGEIKSKDQKVCPRKVPLTYAKNKIGKVHKLVNSETDDGIIFIKRFDEIENMPIGNKFTVEKFREVGFHGQEFREVLNYAICKGLLRKQIIYDDNGKPEFHLFERVNGERCDKWNDCDDCKIYERCKCGSSDFINKVQMMERKE